MARNKETALLWFFHMFLLCYFVLASLKLIRQHGSIEKILPTLDRKKYTIPKDWIPAEKNDQDENDDTTTDGEGDSENVLNDQQPDQPIPTYVQARDLFHNHETTTDVVLKWTKPQSEELTKFLVDEQGFNADRVKSNIEKLEAAYQANLKPQTRMDAFFAVKPSKTNDNSKRKQPTKRQDNPPAKKKPKATDDHKKKVGSKRQKK
jgi:flap endonuclease-1